MVMSLPSIVALTVSCGLTRPFCCAFEDESGSNPTEAPRTKRKVLFIGSKLLPSLRPVQKKQPETSVKYAGVAVLVQLVMDPSHLLSMKPNPSLAKLTSAVALLMCTTAIATSQSILN